MTVTAFPGHAMNCPRSYWPLLGWRLVARISEHGAPVTVPAFPGNAVNCLRSSWLLTRWRSLARISDMVDQ